MTAVEPRLQRSEHVLARQGEQELLLLSVGSGRYYSLNEVGSRVWDLCDGTRSAAEVSAEIAREFDAPLDEITSDIQDLLAELGREQLVRDAA